jgi:protein phosphatase
VTVLRSGTATDTGLVRSSNQDRGIATSSLFAVADGMGGHAGGEVASKVAMEALQQAFGQHPSGPGLFEAVSSANTAVWVASQESADLRGMGTTLTAVALVNEGGRDVLALVNVGDSRSYRFHDGELTQITTDHSLAEEMVRNGEITAAEAMVHPHRHILTRALGVSPEVNADLWRIRPEQGDRFLLCSDGLTNELSDDEITEILSSIHSPQEAVEAMVQAARDHGGSDNITAVLVDVIIGEAGAGSDPAVTAVEPEAFADDPTAASAAGEGASPAAATDDAAASPASGGAFLESDTLKGRERRRARRRERRRKGARRLLTFRALLVLVILAAVIYGAFYAVRWYNNNSYFVKSHDNELLIYQGRIGGFLWYHPVVVQHTGVRPDNVPAPYLPSITAGVQESSLADARTYVKNLKAAQKSTQTTTPPPVPTTTTTTTTTTTVPGLAPPTTAAGGI